MSASKYKGWLIFLVKIILLSQKVINKMLFQNKYEIVNNLRWNCQAIINKDCEVDCFLSGIWNAQYLSTCHDFGCLNLRDSSFKSEANSWFQCFNTYISILKMQTSTAEFTNLSQRTFMPCPDLILLKVCFKCTFYISHSDRWCGIIALLIRIPLLC